MVAPAQTTRSVRPAVSIVLAVADDRADAARIESLGAAAAARSVELVIVATEGWPGLDALAASLPHARLVHSPRGSGIARRRAAGMRLATGDIVALIDNDAGVDSEWIAQLLSRCRVGTP